MTHSKISEEPPISVKPYPDKGPGWALVEVANRVLSDINKSKVEKNSPLDVHIRKASGTKELGPEGWSKSPKALSVEPESSEGQERNITYSYKSAERSSEAILTLAVSPALCSYINKFEPLQIKLGNGDWSKTFSWPDNIVNSNRGNSDAVEMRAGARVAETDGASGPSPQSAPPGGQLDSVKDSSSKDKTEKKKDKDDIRERQTAAMERTAEATAKVAESHAKENSLTKRALWLPVLVAVITGLFPDARSFVVDKVDYVWDYGWDYLRSRDDVQEAVPLDPNSDTTALSCDQLEALAKAEEKPEFGEWVDQISGCEGSISDDAKYRMLRAGVNSGSCRAMYETALILDPNAQEGALIQRQQEEKNLERALRHYGNAVAAGCTEARESLRRLCDQLGEGVSRRSQAEHQEYNNHCDNN